MESPIQYAEVDQNVQADSTINPSESGDKPFQSETASQMASSDLSNRNPSPTGVLAQVQDRIIQVSIYQSQQNPQAVQSPPPPGSSLQPSPLPSDASLRSSLLQSRLPSMPYSNYGPQRRDHRSPQYSLPQGNERSCQEQQRTQLAVELRCLLDEFVELEHPVYDSIPNMSLHLINMYAFYRRLIQG
ncbi:uncharacterized protein LOC114647738 isoform X2 [Erpetoichthys calabaricus]|nr:uncharacterized protein LOC114647738 isoform X2 [Erpetoichthys calabaricus]